MLILHNSRDPLVGVDNAEQYVELVGASGYADMVRVEYVDRMEHVFMGEETLAAFQELVEWVESLK